jgi:hypothetical protein
MPDAQDDDLVGVGQMGISQHIGGIPEGHDQLSHALNTR